MTAMTLKHNTFDEALDELYEWAELESKHIMVIDVPSKFYQVKEIEA